MSDGTVAVVPPRRVCAWCGRRLRAGQRADSLFCGQRCRQASHRFAVRRCTIAVTARPLRFCYADPVYPGKAHLYPEKREIDHAALIPWLRAQYPGGWALSTSAEALREVWQLCPEARLCVWVRWVRRIKSFRPLSAWEPLLVSGGRKLPVDAGQTVEDALVYKGRYQGFPGALIGMKPPQFSEWMFRQLGARTGDTLDDLFPGSGAVGEAWRRYTGVTTPAMKAVAW